MVNKRNLLIITLPLLLNACGEFSYKRGASGADFANTKQLCQKESNGETADECLKKNGWVVQKLDALEDIDLFATASITNDNRSTDGSKGTSKSASSTETATQETSIESDKQPVSVTKPKPTDIYSIGSWWKIGGDDNKLKANMSECTESLGTDHQPDIGAQKYTRAFVICMHNKGWTALKNVK
jgi:hypothetical protein